MREIISISSKLNLRRVECEAEGRTIEEQTSRASVRP